MNHAVLQPAGSHAHDITGLFWVFTGISVVVYVLVLGFLVYALRRRRRPNPADTQFVSPAVLRTVGGALAATGVVLVILTLADLFANRALASIPPDAMQIRITAHQWWWEIEYLEGEPARRLRTANHLVIPAGRPVLLHLTSADVIHSFWVPSLNGKKDLLPGYATTLALQATLAGDYRGECAEFCGYQHAHMSVDVLALPPEEFVAWQQAQLAEAAAPANDLQRRGREVYLSSSCRGCHAIQGTGTAARMGPDLTHVASRPRLAAGSLPNTESSMAAWISDPQSIKPGTRMPPTALSAEDLVALTAYLGNLR